MSSFDEDLIADFEVYCQRSGFVSGDLVLFLSMIDGHLELLVKYVQIHYKAMGMCRDKVYLRVVTQGGQRGLDCSCWSLGCRSMDCRK